MLNAIQQILPSLAALGVLAYWGIGLAAGLEAFVLTGIFLPGTLIVDAGGFMVQRGLLDFFDLVWFVAIGSILGGEATYWAGRHLRRGLLERWNIAAMPAYARAEALFARHGGFALVLGRFLGPVAAFVPFAAAVAGMERRSFRLWNALSGVPYALAHVGLGYLTGAGLTRLSPVLTREALLVLALAVVAAALWWGLRRLDRALPVLLGALGAGLDRLAQHPRAGSFGARHPGLARRIVRRLDRSHFWGLPATLLGAGFVYLLGLWLGLALDFLRAEPIVQIDLRLAELMHMFWTPALLQVFTWITALGDTRLVAAVLALAALWLGLRGRIALLLGLVTALGTDLVSVMLFKAAFGRPRSGLGYFTETSGSFPSGHAALGVAFFGMLAFIAWRTCRLGPVTAAFLGAMTALLIGLSRLYLVEHYLSDVLAGWGLGGLCLLAGIAVTEWQWGLAPCAPRRLARPVLAGAVVVSLGLAGYAGQRLRDYTKALNPRPVTQAAQVLDDPAQLFAAGAMGRAPLPAAAQSLTGERSIALSFALLARDPAQLRAALDAQGWTEARPATLRDLGRTAADLLRERVAADAALAPLFWDNQPNDLAFNGPATGDTEAPTRARLRLWATPWRTRQGQGLWVAVLSQDDGLIAEEARPAPDLAAALAQALQANGAARAIAPGLPLITLP